jgi:hypothetical protein
MPAQAGIHPILQEECDPSFRPGGHYVLCLAIFDGLRPSHALLLPFFAKYLLS